VCVCVCVCGVFVCVSLVVGLGWSKVEKAQKGLAAIYNHMDSLEPFFNKDSTLDAKTVSTLFRQVAVDDHFSSGSFCTLEKQS
jgi:hypothetical protein